MQFSTLVYIFSLTATTLAKLHYNAVCVDETDAENVYNDAATVQACEWYYLRNKGDEWWNTCSDCVMVTDDSPHCNSAAQHIGGDEITYYCQLAGADNALTS
ncbi:hypothetical protein BDZ45DRAFT_801871 [Acephala macrosclerotiorum]|nr:hypothetical protein BDZ45DRAFT_801871 [Acephala macrosclerotiorum]